jgi:hypothetical protein
VKRHHYPTSPKRKKIDFPPPKNEAATRSPGRFCSRQRGRWLIVMLSRGVTRWKCFIPSPGREMPPLSFPPPKRKNIDFRPHKNEAATRSPGRFCTRQRGRSLIVVLSSRATRWKGFIPSPGREMPPAVQGRLLFFIVLSKEEDVAQK